MALASVMTDRKNAQRIETIIAAREGGGVREDTEAMYGIVGDRLPVVKIESTASSTCEAPTKDVCLME
jgi:hypothetical protein